MSSESGYHSHRELGYNNQYETIVCAIYFELTIYFFVLLIIDTLLVYHGNQEDFPQHTYAPTYISPNLCEDAFFSSAHKYNMQVAHAFGGILVH